MRARGLPEPFGFGYKIRDQVAVGAGMTVLGCSTGASETPRATARP